MVRLLVVLLGLMAVGAGLMFVGRDHRRAQERAAKRPTRYFSSGSRMPFAQQRPVPIPVRSRTWQLGLGLVAYPWLGILLLAVVWFFRQLSF